MAKKAQTTKATRRAPVQKRKAPATKRVGREAKEELEGGERPPVKKAKQKKPAKNGSPKTNRKESVAFETVKTGTKPSRKSTRASANRQKSDNELRNKAVRKTRSPKERAARGKN